METKSIFLFFWQHVKPYKWFYVAMLIPPVLSSFYPFAYNYSIKLLLDILAKADNMLSYQQMWIPIALFLGSNFGLELIWRISHIAAWKSLPYVRRSFLLQTYDYVQHHSYQYFQNNFTGAITSKMKGILSGYDKIWAEIHHGLALVALKILINLTFLIVVNTKLGLFLFIWSACFFAIMYKLSKKLDQLAFAESESQHALIGQISDKIMNIISIFSFAAHKREVNLLDKHISQDFIPKQIKLYKYDFKIQIIGGILYFIKFTFILFYTIHLKIQGLISVGDFAYILGLTLALSEDMWRATVSFQDFLSKVGDLKSAFSILYIPQDNLDLPDAKPLHIASPKIEFKHVDFSYADEEVVFKDLNLIIEPGEKVGVVGQSGAGKSSLINLLMRYFTCDKGEILIDGQNINQVTQETLRQQIAVIPQDTLLFHRTLMDNLRYGNPEASEKEIIEACKKAHIHDFIMSLPKQYQTYAGERGLKLSGGQRQRIAIARAILKNAPILLLDEATSALDSQTEKLIQKSLDMLIAGKKQTVLAIAHRLSTLKHMDRIIVLDKGIIVEQGTHEQLIQQPKSLYSKLWKLQEI
ncbi:MAG: ABC transporter ATP-binding protein [Candidatus Amoebophilus sp.]